MITIPIVPPRTPNPEATRVGVPVQAGSFAGWGQCAQHLAGWKSRRLVPIHIYHDDPANLYTTRPSEGAIDPIIIPWRRSRRSLRLWVAVYFQATQRSGSNQASITVSILDETDGDHDKGIRWTSPRHFDAVGFPGDGVYPGQLVVSGARDAPLPADVSDPRLLHLPEDGIAKIKVEATDCRIHAIIPFEWADLEVVE